MEQLKSYQESIHEVVSKEGLEYLHGVIVGVIEHCVGENDQAADEENSCKDHKEAVTSFFPLHVIEYLSWL